jgi:hypothetical protein
VPSPLSLSFRTKSPLLLAFVFLVVIPEGNLLLSFPKGICFHSKKDAFVSHCHSGQKITFAPRFRLSGCHSRRESAFTRRRMPLSLIVIPDKKSPLLLAFVFLVVIPEGNLLLSFPKGIPVTAFLVSFSCRRFVSVFAFVF